MYIQTKHNDDRKICWHCWQGYCINCGAFLKQPTVWQDWNKCYCCSQKCVDIIEGRVK
jgi:hypothetical protein